MYPLSSHWVPALPGSIAVVLHSPRVLLWTHGRGALVCSSCERTADLAYMVPRELEGFAYHWLSFELQKRQTSQRARLYSHTRI